MTYDPINCKYICHKRQCHGGEIMVWMMVLPSGLLSFYMIKGKFKLADYIALLERFVLPIIKVNVNPNFYYQEDNYAVHKAKIVENYMKSNNSLIIRWPSRSPDLNIIEDEWKIISDMVSMVHNFTKWLIWKKKIVDVIFIINSTKQHIILGLYASIRKRFCKVLTTKGNLYLIACCNYNTCAKKVSLFKFQKIIFI